MYGKGMRAYHWNPSLQSIIEFELLTFLGLEYEFAVQFGERDARVGVEFFGVLGEAGKSGCWGTLWRCDNCHGIGAGERYVASYCGV